MNSPRLLIILPIALLLTACATTSDPIQYYSLNLGEQKTTADNTSEQNKARVIIAPLQLAGFLQQDGLVMQVGDNQLYTAANHQWAEPLDEAIAKLLVQDLNSKKYPYRFERQAEQWKQQAAFSLRLELDAFHATDQASSIMRGRFWIYDANGEMKTDRSFNYSRPLTEDGYPHAVDKLKNMLRLLCDEILNELQHLPVP